MIRIAEQEYRKHLESLGEEIMSKTIDDFLATLPQERQKRIKKMADELVIDIQLSKIRQELDFLL